MSVYVSSVPDVSNGKLTIRLTNTGSTAVKVDLDVTIKEPAYSFIGGYPAEDDSFGNGTAAWRDRKVDPGSSKDFVYNLSTSMATVTPYCAVVRIKKDDAFKAHWGRMGTIQVAGMEFVPTLRPAEWWAEMLSAVEEIKKHIKLVAPPPE